MEERRRRKAIQCYRIIPFICLLLLTSSVSSTADSEEKDHSDSSINEKDPHVHEVHCSRERSRAAWDVIQEYLMPFVERENYQLSSQCKLHPSKDLFRDQEDHKVHIDLNEWRCGYCKKSFRAETYLDMHFDSRHSNLLNDNGKCLADLCGALHCDHMKDSKSRKSKCNPAAAAKNRHLCESLADGCFPVSQGPSAARLHDLFLRQFCDAHTCNKGTKPFPKGGRNCDLLCVYALESKKRNWKHTSIFYLAASILTLMLLPIFYILVYLYQSQMKQGTQKLRRITRLSQKYKPS